jgi:uncharacterized hydrophobic protein (TIGR00271 family)
MCQSLVLGYPDITTKPACWPLWCTVATDIREDSKGYLREVAIQYVIPGAAAQHATASLISHGGQLDEAYPKVLGQSHRLNRVHGGVMNAAQPAAETNLQTVEIRRATIRKSVSDGAALTGPYLAMNVAAAFIAGFGLMENSPAVIIGAMLIAMLFGPILGIAMALAEADLHLLGRALVAEVVGAICVLAVGCVIGLSTRHLMIGSEILNRTAPSLLDLLIALVGGLAGGFAFLSSTLGSVIVGVAIATALVPPLTTCGILLARGLPNAAMGAFLLFLANFSAIAFGAMLVFLLAGYRPAATEKVQKVIVPRLVSVALLLALAIHLFGTLLRTSAQVILQSNIQKVLAQAIARVPGARLADVTLVPKEGKTTAWVVIRTPQPFTPEQVAQLNDLVNTVAGRSIGLTVRSVITAETTRYENVYEPEALPDEAR